MDFMGITRRRISSWYKKYKLPGWKNALLKTDSTKTGNFHEKVEKYENHKIIWNSLI
jgi:hypothetical protein